MINAIYLEHCAAWAISPSVWNYRYCFPDVGSVDDSGVFVVVIVSPKEEERKLFFQGVPNDCE